MHNLHDGKKLVHSSGAIAPCHNDPRTSWLCLVDEDERRGVEPIFALANVGPPSLIDRVQPQSPSHPQAPEAIARNVPISRRWRIPIQARQKARYKSLRQGLRQLPEKIDLYAHLLAIFSQEVI
jgi:hypothetical protein